MFWALSSPLGVEAENYIRTEVVRPHVRKRCDGAHARMHLCACVCLSVYFSVYTCSHPLPLSLHHIAYGTHLRWSSTARSMTPARGGPRGSPAEPRPSSICMVSYVPYDGICPVVTSVNYPTVMHIQSGCPTARDYACMHAHSNLSPYTCRVIQPRPSQPRRAHFSLSSPPLPDKRIKRVLTINGIIMSSGFCYELFSFCLSFLPPVHASTPA